LATSLCAFCEHCPFRISTIDYWKNKKGGIRKTTELLKETKETIPDSLAKKELINFLEFNEKTTVHQN